MGIRHGWGLESKGCDTTPQLRTVNRVEVELNAISTRDFSLCELSMVKLMFGEEVVMAGYAEGDLAEIGSDRVRPSAFFLGQSSSMFISS